MCILWLLLGVDADAQTSSVPQRLNLLGGHIGEHRPGCAQGIKCLSQGRVAGLGRPVHGLDPRIKSVRVRGVERETSRVIDTNNARTDNCRMHGVSMFAAVVMYSGESLSASLRLGIIGLLLRAGASLDNCFRGGPIEASIRHTELRGGGSHTPADVADDASFAAGKAFIAEVRAAGGT